LTRNGVNGYIVSRRGRKRRNRNQNQSGGWQDVAVVHLTKRQRKQLRSQKRITQLQLENAQTLEEHLIYDAADKAAASRAKKKKITKIRPKVPVELIDKEVRCACSSEVKRCPYPGEAGWESWRKKNPKVR